MEMKTECIRTVSKRYFFKIISDRYSTPITNTIIVTEGSDILPYDQEILYKIAKSIKPKIILEIGTRFGYTTLDLARNSPGASVYTIDICREMNIDIPGYQKKELLDRAEVGKAFKNKQARIHKLFGDSRDILTYFPLRGKKLDFIFIDGNHSCDAVIKDTQNVLKYTQDKSIIFWHDFHNKPCVEVREALCYLSVAKKLSIVHIDKTWLACSII